MVLSWTRWQWNFVCFWTPQWSSVGTKIMPRIRMFLTCSHTCGFSVAAIAGGNKCMNVDMSSRLAKQGRDNHRRLWNTLRRLASMATISLLVVKHPRRGGHTSWLSSIRRHSKKAASHSLKIIRSLRRLLSYNGEDGWSDRVCQLTSRVRKLPDWDDVRRSA